MGNMVSVKLGSLDQRRHLDRGGRALQRHVTQPLREAN